MDEQAKSRLWEHGVLVLPDEIDPAAYELILDALLLRPDEPITLYCAGAGGTVWDALWETVA